MFLRDLITIAKLPFLKDRELYRSFYRILGFYPINIRPYKQALLHKSSDVREDGRRTNNERLEFLGDAVLDAVVGDIVYRRFKRKPEGFLTNTRSKIVQRESLNRVANKIGLDKLVRSNGHAHSSHNSYLSGNAFEAMVGAIYVDRGYDYCMRFMSERILGKLIDINKVAYKEVNFKSKLLEWSQKNRIELDFHLVSEDKEDNTTPVFVTEIVVEGIVCGQGKGYSKKESQQKAAHETLSQLKHDASLETRIFEAKAKRTAMEEQPVALVPDINEITFNEQN